MQAWFILCEYIIIAHIYVPEVIALKKFCAMVFYISSCFQSLNIIWKEKILATDAGVLMLPVAISLVNNLGAAITIQVYFLATMII